MSALREPEMRRCLLLAVLAVPTVAFSQEPAAQLRYDYVSANLAVPDVHEIGYALDGSTTVADRLIVFGHYYSFEPRNDIDYQSFQIGVGRIWHVRRNLDFVGSLAYADNEIDTPARRGVGHEGLILGGALRGWLTRRIELSGAAMLNDSRGSGTDTVFEVGMQYVTNDRLSYGGRIQADEDDNTVFVGLRFYFGASRRPVGR